RRRHTRSDRDWSSDVCSSDLLLSSKGYGLLWNNPSLTDFNPADQAIVIDPATGKGKFSTGAKGRYGFLLASDNKDRLVVDVDGKIGRASCRERVEVGVGGVGV